MQSHSRASVCEKTQVLRKKIICIKDMDLGSTYTHTCAHTHTHKHIQAEPCPLVKWRPFFHFLSSLKERFSLPNSAYTIFWFFFLRSSAVHLSVTFPKNTNYASCGELVSRKKCHFFNILKCEEKPLPFKSSFRKVSSNWHLRSFYIKTADVKFYKFVLCFFSHCDLRFLRHTVIAFSSFWHYIVIEHLSFDFCVTLLSNFFCNKSPPFYCCL